MKGRILVIVSLLMLVSKSIAQATEFDSDLTHSIGSVVHASWLGDSGKVVQTSDVDDADAATDSAPRIYKAIPPAPPEMPDWGDFRNPNFRAIEPAPREYHLVGPPQGFIHQDADSQSYRTVVNDPDTVLAYEETFDQAINLNRPDGMGPVGLFADHTLPAGRAFFSYRYLQNSYDQTYQGSQRVGVPMSFKFAPTRGLQDSQVALFEYGATQDFTGMAYLPFQHNEINSVTTTGNYQAAFTNPGDIKIMGLLVLSRGNQSQGHANFGLSIPVGFLQQLNLQPDGTTTAGPSATFPDLPYQVRTSSGTYDLLLGYTYRKQTENWTFGAQANGVIPTGKNTLGYELGDQLQLTSWISRRWFESWSTSARLDYRMMGNIRGEDARLVQTLSPANQPDTQGYRSLNGLLGVNYLLQRPGHRIREQRLFLEAGVPLYQWLDGPQLGLAWTLNAGWGMAF